MKRLVCALSCIVVVALAAPAWGQTTVGEVAVVLRITASPLVTTTGRATRSSAGAVDGLRSELAVLEDIEVPFAIAPSPVLLDELVLLGSDASKAALRSLRALARDHTTLVSPYADVRLTELSGSDVARELATGKRRIEHVIETTGDIAFAPALDLDPDAVRAIGRAGLQQTLATLGSQTPRRLGKVLMLPAITADPDVPDPALNAGRVLIVTELDGAAGVLTGLGTRTDVDVVDVGALAADGPAGQPFQPPVRDVPTSYRRAIAAADDAVRHFNAYTNRDNRLRTAFGIALAHARSTNESDDWDELEQRAAAVVAATDGQLHRITVSDSTVTFTSRKGSVPVTISNHADYPVRVRVTLSSSKLEFPDGASRVVTIQPPGDTITFAASARSSGTFPTIVVVTSSGGSVAFDRGELSVRSTAINLPALLLTVAGALFLLVSLTRGASRRKAQRREMA